MPESDQEAEWVAEFERHGELLVYDNYKQGAIYNNEAKRQAALRWLGEVSRDRRRREKLTLKVAWWTLFAALAAVIVAITGINDGQQLAHVHFDDPGSAAKPLTRDEARRIAANIASSSRPPCTRDTLNGSLGRSHQ